MCLSVVRTPGDEFAGNIGILYYFLFLAQVSIVRTIVVYCCTHKESFHLLKIIGIS